MKRVASAAERDMVYWMSWRMGVDGRLWASWKLWVWVNGVERRGEDGEKVWRGDDLRQDDEYEISSIDLLLSTNLRSGRDCQHQDHLIYEALGLILLSIRMTVNGSCRRH